MRVGVDLSPLTARRTGVGNYCYYLVKHLLALRTTETLLGFSSGRSRVQVPEWSGRLPQLHIPLPTRAVYGIWSLTGRPRVDCMLGGLDVFHATNYFLPPVRRARRVVTIYDLSFLITPELCSPKVRRLFGKRVRRFADEADAILTCSESTRKQIIEHLGAAPEKVTVAYGAVDEDLDRMDRSEAARFLGQEYGVEGPFVLFVGTLEPRKNVPALLKAFSRIASEAPHRLVLVGSAGWDGGVIERMIGELGLEKRVVRVGFIREHRDVAAFYSAADVFVFPSFYEGFGLPVLEAMHCGCPVVTADNSSLPEVAGDAALLHDANDVEGLAGSMQSLIADGALRAEMAAKGLEQAERFSWEACAANVMELYRSL